MLGLGGVNVPPKQFVKSADDSPRSPRNEQCASNVVLTSCVSDWLLFMSSRLGAATAPPAAPFFLDVEHQQATRGRRGQPKFNISSAVLTVLCRADAGAQPIRRDRQISDAYLERPQRVLDR